MSQKYEKLKTLLKELFQLDQPDLDFGFYRVMHARSAEVTQFLDKDLLPQVKFAFAQYQPADKAAIEKELAKAIEQAQALGADPETLPKVKELRAKLADDAVDLGALEAEVYDHLFSFFRRYYSEGDFLSRRVYKPGVYAIPYEGEEVKLHWANADQYYIKTSEYLRDYAFRLRPDGLGQGDGETGRQGDGGTGRQGDPMRVHFRLVDAAEGEHGNVKEQTGKERRFVLRQGDGGMGRVGEEAGELVVFFEYRPATLEDWPDTQRSGKSKPPAQKELNAFAEQEILATLDISPSPHLPVAQSWRAQLATRHVRADGTASDATRLRVHLDRYTARNTFDYFIHKDLGGFLRRELDFYIKNEVMHLDDVENESEPRVEQYLSKIKVIRRIAGKIIEFLAQLEDFQKKLWLKKKFVVETSWCIRLGVIPEEFYPEIAANDAQREEWVRLCAIDDIEGDLTRPGYSVPLTAAFLKAHPTLMVDTRHFETDFAGRLLGAVGDMDEQTEAVLLHSENSQALSLMQATYREQVKCIYIDPPYNTGSDEFIYRDALQHSSWVTMMEERLALARALMPDDAAIFVTIDDTESQHLRVIMDGVFGRDNFITSVAWQKKVSPSNDAKWFSSDHDQILVSARSKAVWRPTRLAMNERQRAYYQNPDGDPRGPWNSSTYTCNKTRQERPNLYYPIVNPNTGQEVWPSEAAVWAYSRELHQKHVTENLLYWGKDGKASKPRFKKFLDDAKAVVPRTIWPYSEVGHTQSASQTLSELMPNVRFETPKPPPLIERMLSLASASRLGGTLALDYFAGSGTTGHAVINVNREDGGRRKFILVEMGDHFDTVLLPRLKKVTYSPEWKDGKPKRLATAEEAERSPRIFKVIRLESYEDTLNNLELRRTKEQQGLLDLAPSQGADKLKEQYMLRYMLDVETRGSQSLLNVGAFTDPTAYKLKVKRPGSDESREVYVDLLETFNWLIGLTVQHIGAPQIFSAESERDGEGRLRLKGRLRLLDGEIGRQGDGETRRQGDGERKTNRPVTPSPTPPVSTWWFRTVTGTTPDGRKTLVIWRKRPGGETAEGIEQDNLVLDEWFKAQKYSSKDSEFDLIYVNGDNNLENLKAPDDTWKVRLIEEDFFRLMFETEGGV